MNIAKLATLERIAAQRMRSTQSAHSKPCRCTPQRFYFNITGATAAEIAELLPDNREYCPNCGGQRITINADKEDLKP